MSPLLSILTGIAAGAAWIAGADGLSRAFGSSGAAGLTFTVLLAVGAAFAALRSVSWPTGRSLPLLGIVIALLSALESMGPIAAWMGATLDAGEGAMIPVRALLSGALLLPAGALLASLVVPSALPGPLVVVGAGIGASALLVLRWAGIPPTFAGLGAGLAVLAAGVWIGRRGAPRTEPVERRPLSVANASLGAAIAFALVTCAGAGRIVLLPTFGNALPDTPVAELTLALSLSAGAVLGLAISAIRPGTGSTFAAAALLLAAVATPLTLGRFDVWPGPFAEAAAGATSIAELDRLALGVASRALGPLAFLGGAALALVSAAAVDRRSLLVGAAEGAVLGGLLVTFGPGIVGLPVTILAVAIVTGTLALPTLLHSGGAGRMAGLAGAAATLAAVLLGPEVDRSRLFVEGSAGTAPGPFRYWTELDADGPEGVVTVRRRGHRKRIFVNGRLDMGNTREAKSHGMLAHLPMLIHPDPRRVLVLGAGNGIAVGAALAHQNTEVLVTERDRTRWDAATQVSAVSRNALAHLRTHRRLGDDRDLLARASDLDVILHQTSGPWTERSSRTSTVEFLATARDRLGEDGLYCHWLSESALTQTGFRILLATIATAFPRVEIWAAQDGDVLILATSSTGPHDFQSVVAGYLEPVVQIGARRAWIETPGTLLSHFLVGDEGVRRICLGAPIHSRRDRHLGRAEADRRLRDPLVDPVPGLARIREDVAGVFANLPEGHEPVLQAAIRARDLELEGAELEAAAAERGGLAQFEAAFELNPHDGSIRRKIATRRSTMGIDQSARRLFTGAYNNMLTAVETDTTYADGFANLGRLLLMNESYDYAISVTRQAIQLEPDDEFYFLQLGRIWKRRGFYDKALPFYERALELNPHNIEVAIGYMDTKLAMENEPDLQQGVDFLSAFLELEPEHDKLRWRIDKLQEAIDEGFSTALRIYLRDSTDVDTGADAADGGAIPDSVLEGATTP